MLDGVFGLAPHLQGDFGIVAWGAALRGMIKRGLYRNSHKHLKGSAA